MKSGLFIRLIRSLKKKWKGIGFVGLMIFLYNFFSLPTNYNEMLVFFGESLSTTSLKGIVTDSFNNKPINGAVIKIDQIPGDSVITTSDGSFFLKEVPGKAGDDVRIYIYAKGYKKRNEFKVLPGPVDIKLIKSE